MTTVFAYLDRLVCIRNDALSLTPIFVLMRVSMVNPWDCVRVCVCVRVLVTCSQTSFIESESPC